MINYRYLSYFKFRELKEKDMATQKAHIELSLVDFQEYCNYGTFTSISCMISVVSQFLFNARSKYNVPFDKWSVADFLNASCNLVYFVFFNFITPENFF